MTFCYTFVLHGSAATLMSAASFQDVCKPQLQSTFTNHENCPINSWLIGFLSISSCSQRHLENCGWLAMPFFANMHIHMEFLIFFTLDVDMQFLYYTFFSLIQQFSFFLMIIRIFIFNASKSINICWVLRYNEISFVSY